MSKWFCNWRRSEALSAGTFKQMCEQARVLEQDVRGIKVLQLADGNIFKLFRVRRLLSLAHVYSYARHFCRNADGLSALGIPTVQIIKLMHFVDISDPELYGRGLSTWHRGRNFRHLQRIKDDWSIVHPQHVQVFGDAYFAASGLTPHAVTTLRPQLKYLP